MPLVFSVILITLRKSKIAHKIAMALSVIELLPVIAAFVLFDKQQINNFIFDAEWITKLGVHLSFAIDGISLLLIGLTAILIPLIILSTFRQKYNRPGMFYGMILFMQSALMGVFAATDGLLFYIFWEAALLPVYFIISLWGGENRIRITLKFFIYTIFGSLFMLLALVYLYTKTPAPHTFNISALYNLHLTTPEQVGIALALFLAFAVKIPIFPFHTWQPDTYVVAPAAGSMLLSAIMLKMGIYGMLRLLLPICPQAIQTYGMYGIILAVIGIIYASIIAINQQEIKRLIAYSSLAHVGLIAAAVLAVNSASLTGSVLQMFAHGVNVFGLFLVADIILVRTQTTDIYKLGGIATVAPKFAIFFMIVMLGSVGLPLTNGFVGEFLMLSGLFKFNAYVAGIAGLSVIFGAVYMFRLYQRTMYGETKAESFEDLNRNELIMASVVGFIIIFLGIYPNFFTSYAEPAIKLILSKYVIS